MSESLHKFLASAEEIIQNFDLRIIIAFLVIAIFVFTLLPRRKRTHQTRPYRAPAKHTTRPYQAPAKHTNIYHKAALYQLQQYGDLSYHPLELMSETEINFFIKLQKAFPGHFIFPQIGASGLIDVKSEPFNRAHFFSALNWIDTARIDFTLCDPQGRVLALIELDDSSHDDKQARDQARNYIYRKAGYRLFRFDCRQMPDAAQIRKSILSSS